MLYISRAIHSQGSGRIDYHATAPRLAQRPQEHMQWGVVDTDDGSEEVVTLADIVEATCYLGVPILGTKVIKGQLEVIKPYQPKEQMTPQQMKMAGLYGVEVTEYCGAISAITYDGTAMKAPVSIRLSDFCRWCGDYLFLNLDYCGFHAVTLIFDNNISFTPHSFMGYRSHSPGITHLGVAFDLRELSWDDRAESIYDLLLKWNMRQDPWESIIDIPDRKAKIKSKYHRAWGF